MVSYVALAGLTPLRLIMAHLVHASPATLTSKYIATMSSPSATGGLFISLLPLRQAQVIKRKPR